MECSGSQGISSLIHRDRPGLAHKHLGGEHPQDISHYHEIFWTRSSKP